MIKYKEIPIIKFKMAKYCYWNNNDAITVVHNKQAI